MPGFPFVAPQGAAQARPVPRSCRWDSRECPGPTSEAVLSRPSTRRVLTAGVIVLAVIAPTVDPVEHAEAGPPALAVAPVAGEPSGVVSLLGLPLTGPKAIRPAGRSMSAIPASRSASRRPAARPVAGRAAARSTHAVRQAVRRAAVSQAAKLAAVRQTAKPRPVVVAAVRPASNRTRAGTRESASHRAHRSVKHRNDSNRATKRRTDSARSSGRTGRGMGAVIAYARAQVGKRYSSGGSGPYTFDCSGLTMRAYAQAGYRLPHSSGGQAARARQIPRSQARPGDLVVGPGHVGIYMGGGMMVDAGNRRVGVVYRRLYGGLHIERL